MKKMLALLLSLVMIVTFMPTMAFADGYETDQGNYIAELFIDGETGSIDLAPGEEVILDAKLFHRYDNEETGRLVTEEIIDDDIDFEFRFEGEGDYAEENHAFEKEDERIVDITPVEGKNNQFICKANMVTLPGENRLLDGFAALRVIAHYDVDENILGKEEIPCDWVIGVGVGCHLDYGNSNILSQMDNKVLDVVLNDIGSGVVIDPTCPNKEGLKYDFIVHMPTEQDPDACREYCDPDVDALTLSKAEIESFIENRDRGFDIEVIAYADGYIYANDRINVNVDDGLTDIFGECYMDYPSGVKYASENSNLYDIKDQFIVRRKDNGEVVNPSPDVFEWRFVDKDPNTLDTPEAGDAASISSDGKLKMDHFGTYWVVAAGIGDYRGFLIGSFELTNGENFYIKKPKAAEEPVYTGDDIQLVSSGEASNGTIQYKFTNELDTSYSITAPRATNPGEYSVTFRVVDDGGNILIPAESVYVRVRKNPIKIVLKDDIQKEYGQMDPEFNFDNIVNIASSDASADSLKNEIHFTRERGEDVGEYNIFARCEDDNYDAVISKGKLEIKKAQYHISAPETVSFDVGKSCTVSYNTDAENIKIEKLSSDSKLSMVAREGNLTIQASEATNETIRLYAEDDNHNTAEKIISVKATNKGIETDSESSGGASALNGSEVPGDADHLTVEPSGDGTFEIELQNSSNATVDVSNNSIVVKVKLKGEGLDGLQEKTDLKAKYESEEHPAWIELIGGYYYICFETDHLSTWSFTGTDPVDLGDATFDLPEDLKAIETGYDEEHVFYQNLNMGDEVLKIAGDPVPRECFNLRFAYLDEGESDMEYDFDRDRIDEPGWYRVKAEAITGSGYIGEVEFGDPIAVADPDGHDFNFDEWESNKDYHWHVCMDNECDEMTDYGMHFYGEENDDSIYLMSAATCTSPAKYFMSCECGENGITTFTRGNALGHSLTRVTKVKATASDDGVIEYYKCSRCGGCFNASGSKQYTIAEMIIPAGTIEPEPTPIVEDDEDIEEISAAEKALVNKVKVTQKSLKTYKSHKIKMTFKRAKVDGKNISKYQIYRKTGKNGTYKRIKTITAKKSTVTYTDKKLKKGKKYYYKVRGVVTLSNKKPAYTKWSAVKSVKCK